MNPEKIPPAGNDVLDLDFDSDIRHFNDFQYKRLLTNVRWKKETDGFTLSVPIWSSVPFFEIFTKQSSRLASFNSVYDRDDAKYLEVLIENMIGNSDFFDISKGMDVTKSAWVVQVAHPGTRSRRSAGDLMRVLDPGCTMPGRERTF